MGEEMSRRTLEAIVVPFDVDRADLPTARGARELLTRGLLAGIDAEIVTVVADAPADKSAIVAAVAGGVARAVAAARARRSFPLVLSGGCLAALGAVGGIQAGGVESVRVAWIDAHGDFNTPATSASGYWDGMALAALCGRCLPEIRQAAGLRAVAAADVVHLAGRSFDSPEVAAFEALGLCVIPPAGIGSEACVRRLAALRPDGMGRPGGPGDLYLHIDLDGLDPLDAPAVGTPCAGGPPLAAVLAALAVLPEPAAMTLATASFQADGPQAGAKARRTLDTCRQLLAAALRLGDPASGRPPVDAAEG